MLIDDLIDTVVSVECGFNFLENGDGTVSTSTTTYREKNHYLARLSKSNPQRLPGGAKTDGIVEGETKRLMNLFTTFAAIEQIFLDVITNSKQTAAGSVVDSVAVSASDTPDQGS